MPDSDIQFPTPKVPLEECDKCLGLYMRVWDQLEYQVFALFHKLVDTDITTAHTIFRSGINLRAVQEITLQLGKNRLRQKDQSKLTALMARVKRAATKRNRIVHGSWTLMMKMGNPPNPKPLKAKSAEWIRQYRPTDKDDMDKLMRGKSQKLEAAYNFRPEQLVASTSQVKQIADDIGDFVKSLKLLPASIPKPIDW